jgi:hypothetical protein
MEDAMTEALKILAGPICGIIGAILVAFINKSTELRAVKKGNY